MSPARTRVEWLVGERWPGGLGFWVGSLNPGLPPGATVYRPSATGFPDVVGGWIDGTRVCRFPNVLAPVIWRAFAVQLWEARQTDDRFESNRRAGATVFRPPAADSCDGFVRGRRMVVGLSYSRVQMSGRGPTYVISSAVRGAGRGIHRRIQSPARMLIDGFVGERWPGGLGVLGRVVSPGYASCFGSPSANLALARRGLLAVVRLRRTFPRCHG